MGRIASSISTNCASLRPFWDFPRDSAMAALMLEEASALGLSSQACLAGSGLSVQDFVDGLCQIEAVQELRLVRNLMRLAGDVPGLATRVGARMTIGKAGMWGFAMLTCANIRDMIEVSHRYCQLSWLFSRPVADHRDGILQVIYDHADIPDDLRDFLTERDIACSLAIVPNLMGAVTIDIETRLPERCAAELRRAFPWARVRSGCRNNRVIVDRALADLLLPNANSLAFDACEKACRDLTSRRNAHLATSIRSAILRKPENVPTLVEISRERMVDPRTLRRQLSAEGISFRRLVNQVRESIARDCLQMPNAMIEGVSERLGFSDAGSFSRAFKSWTGFCPKEFLLNRRARSDQPY